MNRLSLTAVLLSLTTLALGAAPTRADTRWIPLMTDGFGDPNVFAMNGPAAWGGKLYVGTFAWTGPSRFLSSTDGVTWQDVTAPGFGNPDNTGLAPGIEFGGEFYVGTSNTTISGGELWKTSDGTNWTQVSGPGGIGTVGLFPAVEFGGRLFVMSNSFSGGATIWSSPDGVSWSPANAPGFGDPWNEIVFGSLVFAGHLYVGTANGTTGGEIWRTSDGTNWTQVNTDGFGSFTTFATIPNAVFGGHLYAWAQHFTGAVELWRTADGTTWTPVGGPGAGDPNTFGIFLCPEPYGGRLIAGTQNALGGAVWSSADGLQWQRESEDGLGDPNNSGVRPTVLAGELYVTTISNVGGPGLWVHRPSPLGTSYCTASPNSVGPGATLRAEGDASIAAGCMTLFVEGCPPSTGGLFFVGTTQVATPMGDGTLCAGGQIRRILRAVQTDTLGTARLSLDFDDYFGVLVTPGGAGVNYQFWYVDPAGGPAGVNFSDALNVAHAP